MPVILVPILWIGGAAVILGGESRSICLSGKPRFTKKGARFATDSWALTGDANARINSKTRKLQLANQVTAGKLRLRLFHCFFYVAPLFLLCRPLGRGSASTVWPRMTKNEHRVLLLPRPQ
jgi:hypothetical protein